MLLRQHREPVLLPRPQGVLLLLQCQLPVRLLSLSPPARR